MLDSVGVRTRRSLPGLSKLVARWVASSACAVLLVLLAGSHVLPAIHFALEQHAVCPEHGELTHAATAKEAHADSERERRVGVVPVEHVDGEHDHCALLATSPALAVLGARRQPEQFLRQPDTAGARVLATSAHASFALLFYAPKLAPPA